MALDRNLSYEAPTERIATASDSSSLSSRVLPQITSFDNNFAESRIASQSLVEQGILPSFSLNFDSSNANSGSGIHEMPFHTSLQDDQFNTVAGAPVDASSARGIHELPMRVGLQDDQSNTPADGGRSTGSGSGFSGGWGSDSFGASGGWSGGWGSDNGTTTGNGGISGGWGQSFGGAFDGPTPDGWGEGVAGVNGGTSFSGWSGGEGFSSGDGNSVASGGGWGGGDGDSGASGGGWGGGDGDSGASGGGWGGGDFGNGSGNGGASAGGWGAGWGGGWGGQFGDGASSGAGTGSDTSSTNNSLGNILANFWNSETGLGGNGIGGDTSSGNNSLGSILTNIYNGINSGAGCETSIGSGAGSSSSGGETTIASGAGSSSSGGETTIASGAGSSSSGGETTIASGGSSSTSGSDTAVGSTNSGTSGSIDTGNSLTAAQDATNSIVEITANDGGGEGDIGTGFFVSSNGLIATDDHVVAGSTGPLQITMADGQTLQAQVVVSDPSNDLAILQVEGAGNQTFTPLQLASGATSGETDTAIGFPEGGPLATQTGQYDTMVPFSSLNVTDNTVADNPNRDLLAYNNLDTQPGSSGSPVINSAGQVIGLVDLGDGSNGADDSFATPSSALAADIAEA